MEVIYSKEWKKKINAHTAKFYSLRKKPVQENR